MIQIRAPPDVDLIAGGSKTSRFISRGEGHSNTNMDWNSLDNLMAEMLCLLYASSSRT